MENFDIRKAKLAGIITLIMFIFIMVIANAYQYLPTENSDITEENRQINQTIDSDDNVSEDNSKNEDTSESAEDIQVEKEEKRTIETKVSQEEITPLENISDDNTTDTVSSDKTFEDTYSEALSLIEQKQLIQAITGLQDALKLAESSKQKAECYESIAKVYAIAKKYGTALSFAQKAYNIAPSTNREILLARLYYKTGSTDKASERMNNVLRRDFSMDY